MRALQLDETTGLAYVALGILEMAAEDQEQALRFLQRAIDVQPSNSLALSVLAMVKVWSGQPEGAVQLAEKAIRLDPYNSRGPYWNILGVVQFYEGNYQESIAAFEENTRHNGPQAPGFYHYYAASLAANGQTDSARQFLEQNYPGSDLDLDWQTWVYRNFQDKSGFDQLMSWLEPLGVQRK